MRARGSSAVAMRLWHSALAVVAAWCVTLLFLSLGTVQAKSIHASADPVKDEPGITAEDREHWAFKPLARPAIPVVQGGKAVRNDLDRLVQARLESKGLSLPAQAAAVILIRRVCFDLTGLPPRLEDVQAFAAAPTDAAYEAYVDGLLASERYGEKAAQHWLDLARFADSDGYEFDHERKHAWKYRDWVIKSLNADMPYDQFVRLQIAGDETSHSDAVATGFIFSGPDMPDINNQEERRHVLLNDITSTVGSAFLGLTIGCAQCHDHPHDPISQADFYRLRACFGNISALQRERQLTPTVTEAGAVAATSYVNVRGDLTRPGPAVTAAFPRIANPSGAKLQPVPTAQSSGQRSALAHWLTQPSNALFLRTAANRLWQQHFGKPLAGNPNDLGHASEVPEQPELIDYLASELPARQWSLKAMHKMIVMSAAFRQAAQCELPAQARVSSYPQRRLTGEELRDTLLSIAGRLNLKAGGEGVYPALPPEVASNLLKAQQKVTASAAEQDRRSIYLYARRNLRYPLFELFDRPDAQLSCGRRNEANTATQALMLMNSDFSLGIAQALAREATQASTAVEDVVTAASQRCYSRRPTAQELALGRSFLEQQAKLTDTLQEAVTDYCLALLNASALLYVD